MSVNALLAPAPLSLSLLPPLPLSPESSASERRGCKNQSGAMRQAAPQLANHRFEHHKRGGAVRLPATLPKQPSSHAAVLSSSLLHPRKTAAHAWSRFCVSAAVCAPEIQPPPVRSDRDASSLLKIFDFLTFTSTFPPTEQLSIFGSHRQGAASRAGSTFDGKQEVGGFLTQRYGLLFCRSGLFKRSIIR